MKLESHAEIEDRASAFVIARRDGAEWTNENQSELEAWLSQSFAHRAAYLRLDAAWSKADRVRALRPSRTQAGGASTIGKASVRIAAGLILTAGLAFGAKEILPGSHISTYATPVGGRETLRMADGTEIELNTDTVLRTAITPTSRTVWLDRGEAYFSVAHDPAHPFVVNASGRQVTVLGTKFTVRKDARALEVSLFEGRIRFDAKSKAAQTPIYLAPGDVVTATANAVTLSHKSKRDLATDISWRRGVIVFDRTTLADAARELNRYNAQKIVLGDSETAKTTIGGTFEATNVAGFARVAHAALGLRVEYRPGEIVISQ